MSKFFVTGSQGFVGSHLVPKLQSLGHEIVTDLRYLHTQKYDCVIHLASKNNIRNEFDADLIESNIILTKEIFKVSSRIVCASSCVAAFPLNPYAYSKLYAEHLCSIHPNALALRFQNIYGPGNNKGIVKFLFDQPDGATITIRGPELQRDYVWVDDVVEEIIRNLKSDGRFLDLRHAREKAKEDGRDLLEVLNDFIVKGNIEHIDVNATKGVVDVGTGVATETMDLVNLYQKLSGKQFFINVEEAGVNEPVSMVANRSIPNFVTLEQGLTKMISAQ